MSKPKAEVVERLPQTVLVKNQGTNSDNYYDAGDSDNSDNSDDL